MIEDPREALSRLTAALERHLEAILTRRDASDPSVEQAYFQIEDAFLGYEESLSSSYDEYLPIELSDEE